MKALLTWVDTLLSGRVATAAAMLAVLLTTVPSVSASVNTPRVEEAPVGTHGFPFGSTVLDLAQYGFTEQEFLISGQARNFTAASTFGLDGKWNTRPTDLTGDYKVRLLVRRPLQSQHFNGTVVVEWLNVTGFADRAPEWSYIADEVLRQGYAWVGVSAQFIGADQLSDWESGDQARYREVTHPGDSFSYDIFSQAGRAIRAPLQGDPKPLGNLTSSIRHMIAMGQSQSGDRMVTYANAIQADARIYDGLIIHSAFASSPVSQASAAAFPIFGTMPLEPGMPVTEEVPTPQSAWIRDDLNQPVMVINTETELNTANVALGVHQQPDSELIRIWEVAGAGHADVDSLASMNADLAKSGWVDLSVPCGDLPTNDGKVNAQATRAAVAVMKNWLARGFVPTHAPRLQVDIASNPADPVILTDPSTGLAQGGIRLPEVAVPTKTITGVRPEGAGGQFCFLFGGSDHWNGDSDSFDGASYDISPMPEPDLALLYPSQRDYQFSVLLSSWVALFQGFLVPADFIAINIDALGPPGSE